MIVKYIKTNFQLFANLFQVKYLPYYLMIIFSTVILVMSGFDWQYFMLVIQNVPTYFLFVADILGFLICLLAPLGLFVLRKKSDFAASAYLASLYVVTVGYMASTFIKIFTGRVSPPDDIIHNSLNIQTVIDNSHNFQFGLMREQIIGGFPSGHATIMFTLAFVLSSFTKNIYLKVLFFAIAIFVSVGVSLVFHWLSEVLAGAILGFVVSDVILKKYGKENKL